MRIIRSLLTFVMAFFIVQTAITQNEIIITSTQKYLVVGDNGFNPQPGDVLKVLADRTDWIKIVGMEGSEENPITIVNEGGQVHIHTDAWGALELKDCKHVILTGSGDPNTRYGFKLEGKTAGLGLTELSSNITVEFVEIGGIESSTSPDPYPWTFFGIVAKKDFSGNPPSPYPQFRDLIIHDTYIHDVHEGMYLGETKSPGMEFIGMKVYNNVVINTYKEAIQIANSVQDIEINNNFLMNSGLAGDYSHTNLLQIGDNSQGKVYNNILIDCPAYGIIVFGTGQIEISNNFIENTRGMFCDDRDFIFENAEMHINNNYFRNSIVNEATNDFQIIKYYNQYMDLYASNNVYNTEPKWGFINSIVGDPALDEDNIFADIQSISYNVIEGEFELDEFGPFEYFGFGPSSLDQPTPDKQRIHLDPSMAIDLYQHPEVWSATNLLDEQNLDPLADEHPISKYWMPGRNKKRAPYHAIINLGAQYYIEDLYIHDLHQDGDITISYLVNGEWIDLLTDPCLNSNAWNHHELKISSSQIRLSMYTSLKARINEIALYGYQLKSGSINEANNIAVPSFQKDNFIKVYPNPASDWVTIQSSFDRISTDIIDSNGRVVLRSQEKQVKLSELSNGLYFTRSRDIKSGQVITNRLIINH
ncbi:MAG: T9SS type A sorting domain-containing protein [Bacteroidetes bacterium]|jgi:hypothetical protein|nr:T9SS type A sorting domain-containing protein [Bacteroidota bacterium]MBT3748336.1 T9SS type A sorting domain-containing protein [Bacteroidota bacterium]MBT4410663.1 T9SS type A sorting domain-containing protein [Bacteroidota bacterium]MBT7092350.1 T9SS type A sorting domain-containing protein [Bacteroidota bacterium]MBT7464252.1 T9SS type A sorting domain-containing protein [Bacteroidota bacterium]